MNTNRLFTALVGAASVALAGNCVAQTAASPYVDTRFSGHFFFGDSLTDNGNLFVVTGGTQPPSPPYNQRFTNELVYAEYLVPGLQRATTAAASVRTNLDFAFGGATAAPAANPPSFAGQLALFNQRQLTIGANDLVSVFFGANDFFNNVATIGATPSTAGNAITLLANTSVTNVVSGVNTLVAAGGRNFIVFFLPDIGFTPAFSTSPARPLASLYSATYNSGLRASLATALGTAPAGTNFTLIDTTAFVNRLIARPGDFGLRNVTTPFLGPPFATGTGTGTVTDFLFFDSVHPTSTVQRLEALFVLEAINPQFALASAAAPARAALATIDLAADTVITRLDTLRSNSIIRGGGTRDAKSGVFTPADRKPHFDLYGTYNYLDAERVGDAGSRRTSFHSNMGTIGADVTLNCGLTVGGAANVAETNGSQSGGSRYRFSTATFEAYAMYRPGPFFADLSFGGGSVDLNKIHRQTIFASVVTDGSTTGSAQYGHFRLGYEFRAAPGLVFGPVVGVRYDRVTLSGYSETNGAGLEFSYGRQTISSVQGTFGAFVNYQGKLATMDTSLRVSGVYRHDFQDGTRRVNGRLANNLSNTTTLSTYDGNGSGADLGVGVTGMLTRHIGLHVDYTAQVRQDDRFANRISATMSYSF